MKYSKILVISPFFPKFRIGILYCFYIYLEIMCNHISITKLKHIIHIFFGRGVTPKHFSGVQGSVPEIFHQQSWQFYSRLCMQCCSGLVVLVTSGTPIQMLPGPHSVVIKCLLVLGIELQSGLCKAHSTTLYYLPGSCLCIFLQ